MRKLLHRIEEGMDNLKIKKKLYMLYLICVLIPIIITDSVIFFIVRSSEQEKQQHEMANIANAVSYNISNTISSSKTKPITNQITTSQKSEPHHT